MQMTSPVRLPLILLVLQQYAAAVSGSVDEFQCACGYNAEGHARAVRATLQAGGGDATAAVELAAGYGTLVSRILFVASSRPEPTARWLWLLDLFANGARQQMTATGRRPRGVCRWLARAVDHVSRELERYLAICRARGMGDGRKPWRDQVSFEKYLLENVTAIVQQPADGGARVEDFAPRCLYLNYAAGNDDTSWARAVMPPGVGVDWRSAADWLSSVYRAAVRKWVFGTRELVVYQKRFIAAVAVTLMGHVLVHVEHCRAHRLLATVHPEDATAARSAPSPAAGATDGGDDDDHHDLNGGGGGPVGEYELTWMSVGALLDKYKSYLALGPEKYYRTLVEVATNPARDDRGFRLARRAIETHMADLGAGLFGPAATNWTAVADATAEKKPKTLIELIALVDNNISTAERYLGNVRQLLSNVNFKIVNKFMRSTHIWLL